MSSLFINLELSCLSSVTSRLELSINVLPFILGFINLGTSTNRQIANFQFVAPLMAYFNPSLKNTSHVYYFDNGK